jgi:hypothetical protein
MKMPVDCLQREAQWCGMLRKVEPHMKHGSDVDAWPDAAAV